MKEFENAIASSLLRRLNRAASRQLEGVGTSSLAAKQQIILGGFVAILCALYLCSDAEARTSIKKKTNDSSSKNVGWVIDQTSEEAGRGEIIVTKDGVRIKLKTLIAVLTAPKFDATIFDTSTKKYVDLPYDKWTSKYKDKRPVSITPTGKTAKIAGLSASSYRVPSQKVLKEVWFTNDVPVSEDMCAFISTTMHLPSGHGLPVRLEVSRPAGKRVVFDTLKLTKTDKVDPKVFAKPVGYKKVESEYQLFVKESQVQDMGSFFQ